jgi:hypothetical protein
MAKKPADRFQTPDELMEALAPFASPSVVDWPLALPSSASDRLNLESLGLSEQVQVDTEPRNQSATQINESDSLYDWANQSSKSRRRQRVILWIIAILFGLLSLGTAGVLLWMLSQ